MPFFARLGSWLRSKRRKPLKDLVSVDWDADSVMVKAHPPMSPDWNQQFRWQDIVRVCFKDEGMWSSDILFLTISGRDKPCVVLAESRGGAAFIGQLVDRGLFPVAISKRAIASSSGGMYCWPPLEADK